MFVEIKIGYLNSSLYASKSVIIEVDSDVIGSIERQVVAKNG